MRTPTEKHVGEIEALVHMELEFKIQELFFFKWDALMIFFLHWTFYDSFLETFQKLTYIHIQDHCTHVFINEALELCPMETSTSTDRYS